MCSVRPVDHVMRNESTRPRWCIAGARLRADVEVGPYSVIGEHVEVGEGSWIGSHVVLDGHTRIGRRNRIWHFTSIGAPPQDKKYAGEPTGVEIGDGNTIREYVTINRGTAQDAGRHARRQRQLDHGLRALRARLPGRQQHHLRQPGPARRPRHRGRLGDLRRLHAGAPVRAHRRPRVHRHGDLPAQDLPPFVTAAGNMAKPSASTRKG